MRYILEDKEDYPEFDFLVRGGFEKDYMLFHDYEDAFFAAEKLSYELNELVFMYEASRFADGTIRAVPQMTFFENGAVTESDESCSLHFKYYTDAGEWLNPPDDWWEWRE